VASFSINLRLQRVVVLSSYDVHACGSEASRPGFTPLSACDNHPPSSASHLSRSKSAKRLRACCTRSYVRTFDPLGRRYGTRAASLISGNGLLDDFLLDLEVGLRGLLCLARRNSEREADNNNVYQPFHCGRIFVERRNNI
jgi:hypothetical protein